MTGLVSWARRAWIRTENRLRFSRALSESLAVANVAAYAVRSAGGLRPDPRRHNGLLFRAARFTRARPLRRLLRAILRRPVAEGRLLADGPHSRSEPASGVAVPSVLVLKAAGDGEEKGVLFAGNETPWTALALQARRSALLEHYDLVALSAWSPPKYEKLAAFAGCSRDPVYVGISNPDDVEAYALLEPAIEPLPLMASDWLNPAEIRPRPRAQRDIDILMVAGWGRYKRHWLLFDALRDLPRGLAVVLIGRASGGRTLADVQAEARLFGARQDITYLADVPNEEVYDFHARARVSVIFSGREGACVAVTESMFADTPVGLMADAHVGAKVHINSATGVLFRRSGLARQLARFLESSDGFRARAWATEHISCERSSARLNALLRERALSTGRPWTCDIAPLFRRYFVPRYLHASDEARLAPARDELRARFGLALVSPDAMA